MPQFSNDCTQAHFLKSERIKALAATVEAVKPLERTHTDAEDVLKLALRELERLLRD
jgi:hypothetical protein